jgi:hypothetical protein
MTNNLESIMRDAGYIINNADKLANPADYLPILSEIQHIILQSDAKFYEGIERTRVPFKEIKGRINLDNIVTNGCSMVGNIEIARILDYDEKDVSNVIDIICKDQQRTKEQKDIVIKYFEKEGYKYKFLPNNTYGFKLSLNGEEIRISNLYGISYYIKVELNGLKLYITIDTAGNVFIKKSGLDRALYFDNFGLFSLLYKFLRYKERDIKDLEEYENKYKDKIKQIINKGFSEEDFNSLRNSISKKDIDRIRKNLGKYFEKHPSSVYESLYKVIEYV